MPAEREKTAMQITFKVQEKPQPQGSMQAFILPNKDGVHYIASRITVHGVTGYDAICDLVTGYTKRLRNIVTSDNKKLKPWRAAVRGAAMRAMQDSGQRMIDKEQPARLTLDFYFLKPPSVKKRRFMTVKPDLDKLVRSTMDALSEVIYADDSQVVILNVTKNYGPIEGVAVSAASVETEENGTLFSLEELEAEVF